MVFACSQADETFGPEDRAAEVSWSIIISILEGGGQAELSVMHDSRPLVAGLKPLSVGSYFDDLKAPSTDKQAFVKPAPDVQQQYFPIK